MSMATTRTAPNLVRARSAERNQRHTETATESSTSQTLTATGSETGEAHAAETSPRRTTESRSDQRTKACAGSCGMTGRGPVLARPHRGGGAPVTRSHLRVISISCLA
jgi:hypothetical protein